MTAGRLPVPSTLQSLLRRALWRVAVVAMLAIATFTAIGVLGTMRMAVADKMDLLARTAAYSVEPAVMFNDAAAMEEALQLLVQREHLGMAEIRNPRGEVLARALMPSNGMPGHASFAMSLPLDLLKAQAEIHSNSGRVIGHVMVRGDGRELELLALTFVGALALALLAAAGAIWWSSQRVMREIASPIRRMARFTRAVRDQQAFERRLQPSGLIELDALAEDFNELLARMQAYEGDLLARQADLASHNEALAQRATTDALTGLANRAHFHHQLEEQLRLQRSTGQGLAVLYMDADGFKAVNDQHGHSAGDRILVAVADRLRTVLRSSDLVARLGGDEFAALLTPMPHEADAAVVVEKIRAAMVEPVALGDGASATPRLSIGIAHAPEHGHNADELLAHADQAMYRSKRERAADRPAVTIFGA